MNRNRLDQLAHYSLYATIFILVLNFTFALGVQGTEFEDNEMCDNIMVCFLICISFMATFAGVVKVIVLKNLARTTKNVIFKLKED